MQSATATKVAHTAEVCQGSGEERAHEVADGVNSIHNAGTRCAFLWIESKIRTILSIALDTAHEGAIVAIDTRVERRDK
jgi:hypothetical protein